MFFPSNLLYVVFVCIYSNCFFVLSFCKFSGMSRDEAKDAVMQDAKDQGFGGQQTSPRQYDWLISRQRYWGTPIPIIHCNQCKVSRIHLE